MRDTLPNIEEQFAQMIASKTPVDRIRMASSMFDTAKMLTIVGLKRSYGDIDNAQLRTQIFLRLYTEDFSKTELDKIINSISCMRLGKAG